MTASLVWSVVTPHVALVFKGHTVPPYFPGDIIKGTLVHWLSPDEGGGCLVQLAPDIQGRISEENLETFSKYREQTDKIVSVEIIHYHGPRKIDLKAAPDCALSLG